VSSIVDANPWTRTAAVYGDQEGQKKVAPLSKYSNVVRHLGKNDQIFVYCLPERKQEATRKIEEATHGLE
jgi:hypothetical protein